jgi:hypothetical protein
MNERIKEIALQAGAKVDKGIHPITNIVDGLSMGPDEVEKFAELIVNDCVRYLNEDYQRDFDTNWREDLSKGIKKHFGVEE